MRKLITILIVALAAISCGKIKDAHNTLNDIETFINERPDSALTILDSFDTSLLDNKSVWAHQSLLHAQAKDKCYIDETDDSLMTQIVNYYEGKRDKERLFKAYYYLGRIQYNAGNYAESMLSYTKAEQMITKIEDDFTKGLLYAQLGMLHQKYYDYPRSLQAYEHAAHYYATSSKTPHKYYTDLNIGYLLHEQKQYGKAEAIYKEVLGWAYNNGLYSLCQEALEYLIALYDETDNIDGMINIINSQYAQLFPHSIYVVRTKAYKMALEGDHRAIEVMNNMVWELAQTSADTINNYFYEAKINKLLGDDAKALQIYEKMYYIQDTLIMSSIKYPLLSVKAKFLESEYSIAQIKIKEHKSIIIIICVFIVLITVLLFVVFRHRLIAKNLEISRYVEVAEDLESTLRSKRDEIDRISKEAKATDLQLKSSTEFISNMLSKQYELLNKLTSTYYETHGCNKDKEAIYKYVSREIESLSSDKKAIQQLEELVNLYRGNIMSLIRQELPNLSEMEYRLLCYFCVGFSAKAISIFTGDTTNNIYVKKSRIKDEIQKLDTNVAGLILAAISSK